MEDLTGGMGVASVSLAVSTSVKVLGAGEGASILGTASTLMSVWGRSA